MCCKDTSCSFLISLLKNIMKFYTMLFLIPYFLRGYERYHFWLFFHSKQSPTSVIVHGDQPPNNSRLVVYDREKECWLVVVRRAKRPYAVVGRRVKWFWYYEAHKFYWVYIFFCGIKKSKLDALSNTLYKYVHHCNSLHTNTNIQRRPVQLFTVQNYLFNHKIRCGTIRG